MNNLLIEGDNLWAMRYLLDECGLRGKIDLVYTDPPFATNCTFTVSDGRASTVSQVRTGEVAYTDTLRGQAFVNYLRERLLLVRELLSPRGSIYLHTDYKIGHYVKVMMDEVFGIDNFRNDITRVKCNPKNFQRIGYGNIKDMVLFYTKGAAPIWHDPKAQYADDELVKAFPKVDKDGRRYTTVPIHAPGETSTARPFHGMLPPKGRHWRTDVETLERWNAEGIIEWSSRGNPRKKVFADESEGKRVQDIWTTFKDPQYPVYPTEKCQDFIDMIIGASSDEGSIVMDCFCGSGTTLRSAAMQGRRWIGIDRSPLAIAATKKKMDMPDTLFADTRYEYVRAMDAAAGVAL